MKIYHIVDKRSWDDAIIAGIYEPISTKTEGFIHCSTQEQVLKTANRRFKGIKTLLLLEIDTEKVTMKVVLEHAKGSDEKHPHIYGNLPLVSVDKVFVFKPETDGIFKHFPA